MGLLVRFKKYVAAVERSILHPSLYDDQEELLRARLMLIVCLSPLIAFAPFVVYTYLRSPDRPTTFLILAIGHLLVTVTPFSLRLFPTTKKPAQAFTLVALAQILFATSVSGGIYSPVLYTYPLIPILMGFLGRFRVMIACCFVLIATVSYLHLTAPEVIPEGVPGMGPATLGWSILTAAVVASVSMALNHRLRERLVSELSQRTQAELESQEARKLKDSFLGYLSHEMRSPLGAIIGSLDLMKQTSDEAVRTRQVKVMHSASYGMVRLMDDLLDITALERNHLRLEMEPVDVVDLAKEVCLEYQHSAQEQGLTLQLQSDDALRPVDGDRQRLRQVLSNLVSNSLKYTVAGGVELELRAIDGGCRFSVSDSGCGIDPDMVDRIFEPFVRVASVSTRGAGLGLPISAKLLSRMGSQMSVDSVVGEGTTFWFDMPFST